MCVGVFFFKPRSACERRISACSSDVCSSDLMRAMPVEDFMTKAGKIREDGRVVRDMYLVRVKKPEESKGPYDYYEVLRTIPGDEAYRSMEQGECPLVTTG